MSYAAGSGIRQDVIDLMIKVVAQIDIRAKVYSNAPGELDLEWWFDNHWLVWATVGTDGLVEVSAINHLTESEADHEFTMELLLKSGGRELVELLDRYSEGV